MRLISCFLLLLLTAAACAETGAETDIHDGIPVGFTDEGYPYIGNPDAAVTLEEWSDYLCPFCGRHYRLTYPQLIDEYVRDGSMKIVFRDLPLESLHPTAARGHIAANCAGQQGVGLYWRMHDALFFRQDQWNRLPDPDDFLAGVAAELGADKERYAACVANGEVAAAVEKSVAEGQAMGFYGTPSFRFSATGVDTDYPMSGAYPLARFASYIDPLAAGEAPPEEPKPAPPQLPFWASPEGLAPDSAQPGFTVAGDPYKGNPDAAIVVVEFNDYQCPACNRHAVDAQPRIDAALVDNGRIFWVDKHLPLREHEHALVAAVAAECAGLQENYWDMSTALHSNPGRWADADDRDAALIDIAAGLGLDIDAFRKCFEGRSGLERVVDDIFDAQGIITTAPRFVILHDGRGATTGPLAAEQFIELLTKRLDELEAAADDGSAAAD